MACRTLDPDAAPWRIGIEHPHDPSRLVAVVPVATGAVATTARTPPAGCGPDPAAAPWWSGRTDPPPWYMLVGDQAAVVTDPVEAPSAQAP